jgi:hypothetical protein
MLSIGIKKNPLILESYINLTTACSQYQDKWICDETLYRLLNAHYPHLKNTFVFTLEALNLVLSAKAGPVIGHGIVGKDIPIMARLTKVRRWSKRWQTRLTSPDLMATQISDGAKIQVRWRHVLHKDPTNS